jgi:anti-anti-sigma factor
MKREEFEYTNLAVRLLFDEDAGICIVIFRGSMDAEAVLDLKGKTKAIITQRKYNYIVDVSHVTYMSSTGLGFLTFLAKYRRDFFYLSMPHEEIRKPFDLLEMEDIFKFYHDPIELERKNRFLIAWCRFLRRKLSRYGIFSTISDG